MRMIASILNIRLCTTTGMSPIQNKLYERAHAVKNIMLIKLKAEIKVQILKQFSHGQIWQDTSYRCGIGLAAIC